jgi:hypothetical protein
VKPPPSEDRREAGGVRSEGLKIRKLIYGKDKGISEKNR